MDGLNYRLPYFPTMFVSLANTFEDPLVCRFFIECSSVSLPP